LNILPIVKAEREDELVLLQPVQHGDHFRFPAVAVVNFRFPAVAVVNFRFPAVAVVNFRFPAVAVVNSGSLQ
jgi:hypothetical protein